MTVQELKSAFVFAYNYEPDAVCFTMDRVNLIGEHFNYNNDSVFSNTLSFGIYLFLLRRREELFDLKNDPYSFYNLAENPKYKAQLKQMRDLLIQEMLRTEDPLLKSLINNESHPEEWNNTK
jgi:galactokinase